ncbi:MAG: hypothetical protein K2P58_09975 [Hyphomonadaceae bacterium]|nr:hypothetical protein [Hyphomonadaceae bacterium]
MLIVPPLINCRDIDGGSKKAANDVVVMCPLAGGPLGEGHCYDFQAYAQGNGPDAWREPTAQEYEHRFRGSAAELARRCILHQIEIVSAGDYAAHYLDALKKRLDEIIARDE